MKNKRINDKVIEKGLNMLPQLGYSKLIHSLIKVLLSHSNDRPLPSQIYAVFRPYEKFILNLEKFEFETNHLYNSLYPSQVAYWTVASLFFVVLNFILLNFYEFILQKYESNKYHHFRKATSINPSVSSKMYFCFSLIFSRNTIASTVNVSFSPKENVT